MVKRIARRAGIMISAIAFIGIAPTAFAGALIDMPRSEWGCELSNEKVVQGIVAAMISRDWTVSQNEYDGKDVAQIVVRNRHTLIVDIAYDTKSYDITYASSQNLKYVDNGDGTATIHGNANRWISNLHQDIAKQVGSLCSLR